VQFNVTDGSQPQPELQAEIERIACAQTKLAAQRDGLERMWPRPCLVVFIGLALGAVIFAASMLTAKLVF
jgi:hypothetical protein